MSNTEAKLHLSLEDGVFEISGSEVFVSQQIDNFKEIILEALQVRKINLSHVTKPAVEQERQVTSSQNNQIATTTPQANAYPRVLHTEENTVKIIKKIPGSSTSKKTINTALIYLWGMKSIGVQEASAQEIRDQCAEQSCLDTNFSTIINGAKEFIIVDGKKGSGQKNYKLTLPGVEQAEILLEEMNGV